MGKEEIKIMEIRKKKSFNTKEKRYCYIYNRNIKVILKKIYEYLLIYLFINIFNKINN